MVFKLIFIPVIICIKLNGEIYFEESKPKSFSF
jgi:hypothetical protein